MSLNLLRPKDTITLWRDGSVTVVDHQTGRQEVYPPGSDTAQAFRAAAGGDAVLGEAAIFPSVKGRTLRVTKIDLKTRTVTFE